MEKIVTSIKEKDIENLPQLDRIEYRMERDKIVTDMTNSTCLWILKKLIVPISLILVFIYYAGGGILRSEILEEMLLKMLKTSFIMAFVAIPFDIYYMITGMKEKGKLNDKFFNKKEEEWKKRKK